MFDKESEISFSDSYIIDDYNKGGKSALMIDVFYGVDGYRLGHLVRDVYFDGNWAFLDIECAEPRNLHSFLIEGARKCVLLYLKGKDTGKNLEFSAQNKRNTDLVNEFSRKLLMRVRET